MIQVNGVQIKTPDSFQVSLEDIVKAERNANGDLVGDRIATKRKLMLAWTYLSNDELSTLLTAVSDFLFSVTYPDPQTGEARTGTFYAGSKNSEGLVYNNGSMTWRNLKFNMIER